MAATPEERQRALSQRKEALKRANLVRRRRAEIKEDLRTGDARITALLIDPPDFLLTASLAQVLLAVPGYGQVRVNRLLKRCRISPLKTIGGLSRRQREELAQALAGA